MKIEIVEVDNDYHCVTDIIFKDFDNIKEAEEWCKEESWTGKYYFVRD